MLFAVINFLKCVVTEVVLFSVVASEDIDISQGSVATHLRCGGIFSDRIINKCSPGRSARSSLYSRQAGVSGFWCHRLEQPASPHRIMRRH